MLEIFFFLFSSLSGIFLSLAPPVVLIFSSYVCSSVQHRVFSLHCKSHPSPTLAQLISHPRPHPHGLR